MSHLQRLAVFACALSFSVSAMVSVRAQAERLRVEGNQGGERLGVAVADLGDLDGDGFAELAVGSDLNRVDVYRGSDASLLISLNGDATGDNFGVSLARVGDLDFDGVDDFAVGAPQRGNGGSGYVRIFSGATRLAIRTLNGALPADRFGDTLLSVSDLDLDGVPDLVVGAPTAESSGNQRGAIEVFSGFDGIAIYRIYGLASNDFFGSSLTAVGDRDLDGAGDFLVGAPGANAPSAMPLSGTGTATLISGRFGIPGDTWSGAALGDAFGASLAFLGDVDFDGQDEFAVGSPGRDFSGANRGSAQIFEFSGPAETSLFGSEAGARFGTSLARVDGFVGLGVPGLLIGEPQAAADGLPGAGRLLHYLPTSSSDSTRIEGDAVFGNLGGIAVAVDIDGDGRDEIVAATPGAGTPLASGRVAIFSRRAALGPAARSRVGVVGSSQTAGEDLLLVNGSAGGAERRVDVDVGEDIFLEIEQPSGNLVPARWTLFGVSALPRYDDAVLLPAGLGAMSFVPCPLLPSAQPFLFIVADGLGGFPCPALTTAHPAPWSIFAGSIAAPAHFTLQGLIETSGGGLALTNAVVIAAQ